MEADNENRSSEQTSPSTNWNAVKVFFMENKIDSLLWMTRMFTVINVIWYLIPIFSPFASLTCYKRALICNAAVSALRLHQRIPNFQFTRQYFVELFQEDSCHYLLYSLMFLYTAIPVTAALLPIGIFAVLHTLSFSKKLLDILGTAAVFRVGILRWARNGIDKVQTNQISLLRMIASTEIMIMLLTIALVFSGTAGLLLPFMYYKFLTFRYASRRNPYSRLVFGEFRIMFQQMAMNAKCPGFVRNLIFSFIRFISNLAPPVVTANT
ncbi:transmembrane protein 33-like [Xenia sp. Carnegie-2017]|uniref:transmembrane protein 33-like n=1 Tax=Xenia sp. Carnegie-2017 TaxID=2897299 RepID=UPI001F0391CB|nr:transmembrane protein 33-like [Xenia sp. Carnegie-2017]